ncbi:arginine--tRNA ligase [Paracrocinitomix mangrovi]|uniref:arginine--tRNA ligase n=1 Tax=Paracrocinitomix mangrovi TaxID=2862509 RepID=UPI001C8EF1AC|nr:arginine--tRNA ligase [Paracrocinitomix mangrovi]UKN01857.1 arginine--tRNA ligase [Paracrocinitomix mangrovi]
MSLEQILMPEVEKCLAQLYDQKIDNNQIQLQKTRTEFVGDITLVVFPFLRISKKGPEQTAEEIGALLIDQIELIKGYNVVKGFLNLEIANSYWLTQLNGIEANQKFGVDATSSDTVLVEFSSPNTNKPLHLGHLRNIFLGDSVSSVLQANGKKVVRTQIINDRGIHICKSMYAWKNFGNTETPESAGMKGDKLVGKYYVEFDKAMREQAKALLEEWNKGNFGDVDEKTIETFKSLKEKEADGKIKELINNQTPIMAEVKEMLLKWEQKDPEVYQLWEKMNGWVYNGFDQTYKTMGVGFDHLYYESDTFITGKELVEEGLAKGIFYKREDGSVWVDLTDEGLDEKLLLRSDGTAVYMTQDIGTAYQRFKDYPSMTGMVYTVGNEQDYHFKVLFLILQKLGFEWAKNCFHLSYGMVELRNNEGEVGKMKSREGTVVDADDLMAEVIDSAKEMTQERGQLEGMSNEEKEDLYRIIGLGGLKYYLLKVDPKKNMAFNPEESVDLNGNTGPFIQYAHARISSLLRKAGTLNGVETSTEMVDAEREIIKYLTAYPDTVKQAGDEHSPALLANYTYDLVKMYNSFYQSVSIFKEEDEKKVNLRLTLSKNVGKVIQSSMAMLGIEVPERM